MVNILYLSQPSYDDPLFILEPKKIVVVSIYSLSYVFLCTIGLLLIPVPFMHAFFIFEPIAYISLAVYGDSSLIIVPGFFFAMKDFGVYFLIYKNSIRYSAIIASTSIKIVLKNILKVILILILVLPFISLQINIAIIKIGNNIKYTLPYIPLLLFHFYWLYYTAHYFLRVYVSTIITINNTSVRNEINIARESIKNSFFALGSICIGSLFEIFNSIISHIFVQSGTESYRDYGSSFFYKILSGFVTFFLTLIDYFNCWVFTYIAMYGTKYTNSLKDTFRVLCSKKNQILLDSMCLQPFVWALTVIYAVGYVFILIFINIEEEVQSLPVDIALATIGIFSVSFYLNVISSASIAFLFLNSLQPVSVKEKHPQAYEAIRDQCVNIEDINTNHLL
ncbi:pH nine-sensitive protein 1 [Conglomerata obtusa]